MEINTNAGKTYTVVSASGCTVTTADGTQIKEIAAGQDYFTAISGVTVISDDAAVVQEVFKGAPYQKLRLLGVVGGDNEGLPAGYTRLEYLEQPYGADVQGTLAYFNLGSYTCNVEQGDSLRLETLHQIPEIPESWERMGGEGFKTTSGTLTISAVYSMRGNDDNNGERPYPIMNNTLAIYTGRVSNPENPTIAPHFERGIFIEGTNLDTNWHVLSAYIDKSIVTFRRDNESISYEPLTWPDATGALTCFGQRVYIRPFVGRKKYFKFWMNGELKHHLVPCLDETSTPCMYDLVTKETHYNAGNGLDFIPSPT